MIKAIERWDGDAASAAMERGTHYGYDWVIRSLASGASEGVE